MQIERLLQKLEIYAVAAVAVLAVSGIAFVIASPFSPQDYGLSNVTTTAPQNASVSSPESPPALLEPALRSLDGVAYHG